MATSKRSLILSSTLLFIIFISQFSFSTQAISTSPDSIRRRGKLERRSLLSFKENPSGANSTFECSPSGPCISCVYSEKNDDKYRCSETGYHIPLKCVEIKGVSKVKKSKKPPKDRSTMEDSHAEAHVTQQDEGEHTTSVGHRRLLGNSSPLNGGGQAYITYRSCIPAVFEEKLSVLGFEVIMLGLLLISGPVVYFRKKGTIAMSGVAPTRVQSNPRF